MKNVRYLLEYAVISVVLSIFYLLPVALASASGGWIGRTIGPRLSASRKAMANIKASLPNLSDAEHVTAIRDMWDNLGRVIAEYPHLSTIARYRTESDNGEIFTRLKNDGKPAIIIGGHLANWEIAGAVAHIQHSVELDLVYRSPNNPYVDRLLARCRRIAPELRSMPKSSQGARDIVRSLKGGRHVALLIDQKYNEGMAAMFFDRPAMTSPAFVQLAQRFRCPLIMGRFERLPKARFRVTCQEMALYNDTGLPRPVDEVIEDTHRIFEQWITERPGQWLWLHRRWSERAERLYQEQHEQH